MTLISKRDVGFGSLKRQSRDWSKDHDLRIDSLWYPVQRRHELLTGFDMEQRRSNTQGRLLEVGPTHSSEDSYRKVEEAKGLDYSRCMLHNTLGLKAR